ncbi:DUF2516 family protein [Pseudarthrobacter sp. B907]|uniref:DUF2516 family protein n=1 Tax=Micrococcaceae TaxID=1268 RepID=UPI0011B13C88|nr:DUF2516 family protein [Arthrobacter sp. UKPF54-2]QDY89254.1 DUF2516 family protein [Arthrobacter sp. UKPF54-2]
MDGRNLIDFADFGVSAVLLLVSLSLEIWAFLDCLRHKANAFEAVSKRTKTFWLALTGGALLIGVLAVVTYRGGSPVNALGLFGLAAVTAAAVYLADVRPAVKDAGRGGSRNMGPYGPW